MMLERVLRYRILVPIVFFYFVMSVLTPLTHDDLEWATSYGTEMLNSFYATLNGRYLGNTFEVIATRIPPFRYVIYVLFSIGILLIIQKSADDILGKDRHPSYHLLVLFTLILCIPATIYSQIYGWFAGFYNYVPATFASLVILRYCIKLMYHKTLLWWEMVILMITALLGQWFMESMTLFNVGIILIATLVYYVQYRKHLKQFLIALISSVLGAIIMFINPQYVKIFSGQSDYQKVSNKDEGLLHRILKTFLTQFPEHIIYQSILILLIVVILLGILLYHSDISLVIKGSLFVGLASAPIYTFFIRIPFDLNLKLHETSIALLDFTIAILFYSVLIVTTCYTSVPKRLKTYIVLLFVTIPIMVAPLLIVQPIGPRNFYSVFIIFVMVAFLLYRYMSFEGPQWQGLIKIFAVTFSSVYIIMFLIIAISDHTRIAKIHYVTTENPKLKTYHMKRLPFEDYMQRSSPETERRKKIFKEYYEIPQNIKLEFPPKVGKDS